jgi:hypothetical protein
MRNGRDGILALAADQGGDGIGQRLKILGAHVPHGMRVPSACALARRLLDAVLCHLSSPFDAWIALDMSPHCPLK